MGASVLSYQWYENFGDLRTEFFRHLVALDRSPWRRTPGRGLAIRVSTSISPGLGGLRQAEIRLKQFARATEKELLRVGIKPAA